jgi:tripartite-type tricarboxylate transporter receptor subunit TctC
MHIDRLRPKTARSRAMLLATGIVVGSLLAPNAGLAQQYPSRPIRVVVSSPPGGAPDIAARLIAEKLGPSLGQTLIVENRPGANGNLAMEVVAKSPPDGYTLMLIADSMVVINPHLYSKMPVDTLKGITPIASVAITPSFFLTVNPSLPVKNFQEFIEYARAANPPLAYASGGPGSQHQMAMEMLKQRAGINLVHIPYKGGSPAVLATVAGEVAATIAGSSGEIQIRAGKLRGLAATGPTRSPSRPELPTIGEFYPGYQLSAWIGMFGPPGLPEPVLGRLRTDINRLIGSPEAKAMLNPTGLDPYLTTPQQFIEIIQAEYEKYGNIVRLSGTKLD